MEELLSTEALDREILEDARKKAYKILKTADDNQAAHVRDWEKKTRDTVNSIQKVYTERTERTEAEILARLPLDKRRLRSESSESFLKNAVENFLSSLGREKLFAILEGELLQRIDSCAGVEGSREFRYSGMDAEEAHGVLERVLAASGKKDSLDGNWEFKEEPHAGSSEPHDHTFPSVVILTQVLKLSASVEDAARAMVKDKRAELASALLGEGVLND